MTKTAEQRKKEALSLREQGYNCAQSVIMVFDDLTGLDAELAARLTSGLGAGCGGTRELCGVVNAMAITQGLFQSSLPAGKALSMKEAGTLAETFASENQGRLRCADLKGKPGIRSCNDLVIQGVEILHEYFKNRNLHE